MSEVSLYWPGTLKCCTDLRTFRVARCLGCQGFLAFLGFRVEVFSSYTKVYSVIYDSGSFPDSSIFFPRETPPRDTDVRHHLQTTEAHCGVRVSGFAQGHFGVLEFRVSPRGISGF